MIITNNTINNPLKYASRKRNNASISISSNLAFGNKISVSHNNVNRLIEIIFKNIDLLKRKFNNRINDKKQIEKLKTYYEKLMVIDENSPEYIKQFYLYSRNYGKGKEVEINLESRRISDIVKSNDACIFIMNHDDRKIDPAMLGIFNTLLNAAYLKSGKASSCPRPRIIINEDILLAMDGTRRAILEKFGVVGIDASLFTTNGMGNAKRLLQVMKDFVHDKAHIFIFPEGKMAAFKDLDLEYKFQTGVGQMVDKLTKTKKSVKIVPVSFAYNSELKQFLGSIHIGEPIYFKRNSDGVFVTKGNVDSDFALQNYVDFFQNIPNEGFKIITDKGKPVVGKELPNYIAGVLCENLRICTEEAKKQLPQESLGDKVMKIS